MLKTDQIELAILNLIFGCSDVSGPTFYMTSLEQTLSRTIGYVDKREIVDAILTLYEDRAVDVGRYVGRTLTPYDTRLGKDYFYDGHGFVCTPSPRARRRQQELSKGNRHGVFISHISEEHPVAVRMQQLIGEALSGTLPVFVSSDRKSIESGDPWYDSILGGIRKSQAIVLLLSPASIGRPWINFEAGIGIGQDSQVIPVVWRGLSKGDIGLPLGRLHARELRDEGDLTALLQSLATICGTLFNPSTVSAFLQELPALDNSIPRLGVSATPLRDGRRIRLKIQNTGTRPVELVEAELLVSEALRSDDHFQEWQPVLQIRRIDDHGVRYIGRCLTTYPSTVLHLGINPLMPILAPGADYIPDGLGLTLPATLSLADEALPVRWTVFTKQGIAGPETLPIAEIPMPCE